MSQPSASGWTRFVPLSQPSALAPQRLQSRVAARGLGWVFLTGLVALLEVAVDPLAAWERLLDVLFGLLIPIMALAVTLAVCQKLASPLDCCALAARHGANRRRSIIPVFATSIGLAMSLTCAALVVSRIACHPATEPLFNRDLVMCCGIGCLATGAYIAILLAATRLGFGRFGAWFALIADLTLGQVNAGWSIVFLHQHVVNLISHPGVSFLSAKASSLILLGFMVMGLVVSITKTPR